MYGLALSIAKNNEIAEDAMQCGFAKLLEKFSVLSTLSKTQEKAYVLTTIANTTKDFLKQENKIVLLENDIVVFDDSAVETELAQIVKKANKETVEKSLEALPQKYQDVLILFYYLELSLQECANVLEIKKDTFRKRKTAALSALAKELEKRGLVFE